MILFNRRPDHLGEAISTRCQHHQPVKSQRATSSFWHLSHRCNEILVNGIACAIARFFQRHLAFEVGPLERRVGQFGEPVGNLHAAHIQFEPFSDAPNDKGLLVNTEKDLYEWTSNADKAKLQVIVHAIGDRAIHTQLDIFQRVERENGPRDRRFRIEHAQHIALADISRFAPLGVIASMQPYHAIDDGRWAEQVIGPERAKGTYAFKSLLDHGATLAFGSDWFVAPPTPLVGIYAAVTRRTLDDKNPNGWHPEQKISVEQALRAYTAGSAYSGFHEHEVGILKPGMLADLVMIDHDLTRIPPNAIRDARVMLTVVGGRVVYDRDGVTH